MNEFLFSIRIRQNRQGKQKAKEAYRGTPQNIHTYIRTYVRTYVRTYIHTYIHTYIYTYIHMYMEKLTYYYTKQTYTRQHDKGTT